MKKLKNPYLKYPEFNCFGCAPHNPLGLNMEFELHEETVKSIWSPKDDFQGFHGILHGGIIAASLDEAASWAIQVLCKTSGFTSEMNVKYIKPAYLHLAPYRYEAVIQSQPEKHAIVEVKMWDKEDTLCATAIVDYHLFSEELARESFYYPGADSFFEK